MYVHDPVWQHFSHAVEYDICCATCTSSSSSSSSSSARAVCNSLANPASHSNTSSTIVYFCTWSPRKDSSAWDTLRTMPQDTSYPSNSSAGTNSSSFFMFFGAPCLCSGVEAWCMRSSVFGNLTRALVLCFQSQESWARGRRVSRYSLWNLLRGGRMDQKCSRGCHVSCRSRVSTRFTSPDCCT